MKLARVMDIYQLPAGILLGACAPLKSHVIRFVSVTRRHRRYVVIDLK